MRDGVNQLAPLTEHCKRECRDSCIFVLQWHITERCNLRCTHCYQGGEVSPELDSSNFNTVLDQFAELIDNIRAELGCNVRGMITLTGGEPLVHEDFFALAREIRRRTFMLGVLTNGTLVDESTAAKLAELNPYFVQVSIDGPREVHDVIRGEGMFDRACTGLRNLVKVGIRTSMSFTAHSQNFRRFNEVVDVAEELGVDCVWSDRLIPTGAGAELLAMTSDEVQEYFKIMMDARINHAGRVFVKMERALQFQVTGERPYFCTAGKLLLTLLPDGTIYPCRRLPVDVGNVTTTTLSEVFHNHPLVNDLRSPETPSGCQKCVHAKLCKGGLRCLTYATTGELHRGDVDCKLIDSCEPALIDSGDSK